ncbi:hypothetical protein K450DRAFT_220780 [Umbelopsis ramanniana AG]|uniref:Uncharacterized protein n=1 Tax=Umbelopsis ramanniana AG TaxID=1314678 RepID=A0AAD5EJ01_UMBRA|nr:uncharacterized protein K450DRAFT_220780 [Umbelopsis ramanniana AG]KAI8583955.1 hypothetical protein K450DRAFT_220780 [Umbelopsis ramanniana AG]
MSSQLSANYFQYNQSEDYIQQLAGNSPLYSPLPTCGDDGLALMLPDSYRTAKSSPYLVNLFTTHDMSSYLAHVSFTDDIFGLPMQLQKLLNEAKEEQTYLSFCILPFFCFSLLLLCLSTKSTPISYFLFFIFFCLVESNTSSYVHTPDSHWFSPDMVNPCWRLCSLSLSICIFFL